MTPWPPLSLALPLVTAALLLGLGERLPRRWVEVAALAVGVATTAICIRLAVDSAGAPFVYWFGGHTPEGGVALGICFFVDLVGATFASFASFLTVAAFLYSWRYFEAVGALFHGLMLVLLAGMVGFCLTGDMFSLFVFLELMSVAAYALTGYKTEEAGPLQGALNFAVVNSVGASFLLLGIALLYGRTGALNMAQVGRSLAEEPADALVAAAFALIAVGLLGKAAAVPLHFAHADAHATAPTPVLVVFSGTMLQLGVYGLARIYWTVFHGPLETREPQVRALLIAIAVVTMLIGGIMCFAQTHLKRLLAYSTISHVGLLIAGLGLLTPEALEGTVTYVVGRGLAKAALFMGVGILLHRYGTVDELELRDKVARSDAGSSTPLAMLFITGALVLTGLPPSTAWAGLHLIEGSAGRLGHGWLTAASVLVAVLTGGAVLRATGRVFAGWGPAREELAEAHEEVDSDDEADGGNEESEEPEPETEAEHGRVPWIMLLPAVVLVAAAAAPPLPALQESLAASARRFQDRQAYAALVLDEPALPRPSRQERRAVASDGGGGDAAITKVLPGIAAAALAALLALADLFRGRLAKRLGSLPGFGAAAGTRRRDRRRRRTLEVSPQRSRRRLRDLDGRRRGHPVDNLSAGDCLTQGGPVCSAAPSITRGPSTRSRPWGRRVAPAAWKRWNSSHAGWSRRCRIDTMKAIR